MITNSNNDYSTADTLAAIRSGKEGRDKVLTYLYHNERLRNSIQSVVYKMGGTQENFKDIFANTLMQFVKTVVNKPDLEIRHEMNTYITSIAKYLWLADKRKENKYSHTEIESDIEEEWEDGPETLILKKEKIYLLDGLLGQLGKNCKEVLMYWANGFKMKEIAEMLQYKSADMAKKKKYKCFKALLSYLENNPNIKAALN